MKSPAQGSSVVGAANGNNVDAAKGNGGRPPEREHVGRYEILSRIGAGGMAEAFRARASGPGGYHRQLIIKRILPQLAADADFVRAFIDEAKILGMLNHPNIVGVYDFGEDDGRHYLALEYLDGPTLAHVVTYLRNAKQKMSVGTAVFIARGVCSGLAAVHGLEGPDGLPLNVIHRDVTPTNIMTTRNGVVKLLDFGIAKISTTSQVTRQGYIKGKAGYLAPEQIKGLPIDARVDLFSLGVVLHEMLSLEHPFYGEGGELATMYRILENPVPPLASFRDDVPDALEQVLVRALARDPAQRFASATEMAVALDPILAVFPTSADDVMALVRPLLAETKI